MPAQPVAHPLAIVPLDSKIPGGAAQVSGAVQVFNGRAFITDSGTITAGSKTVPVTVPYRGTLRICAATTVKMTADSSVPRGEIPGLMIAMDHAAPREASFATGRNSDIVLTPDFRILIGSPGAAEVKVRLGQGGDTCVDNSSADAPYVLVTSVFDGGSYRVQSGQRVMFQHGSLHEVVDQEKEPCGCPPEPRGNNDFPLAQSEGLAPLLHPTPPPQGQVGHAAQSSDALVYNGAERASKPAPCSATHSSSAARDQGGSRPTSNARAGPGTSNRRKRSADSSRSLAASSRKSSELTNALLSQTRTLSCFVSLKSPCPIHCALHAQWVGKHKGADAWSSMQVSFCSEARFPIASV